MLCFQLTSLVLQMKTDFKKMEDEMDRLAMIMNNITDFSGKISDTLQAFKKIISLFFKLFCACRSLFNVPVLFLGQTK